MASGTVYAAFLDKKSYNYATQTSKGVARRPSEPSRANHFPAEALRLLRAAIAHPTGSTAALQRAAGQVGRSPRTRSFRRVPESLRANTDEAFPPLV